jgi:cysteine desulfurase/selenocysteine lyase
MSVRPTFALYNTREDVDKLVVAVRKIVGQRSK